MASYRYSTVSLLALTLLTLSGHRLAFVSSQAEDFESTIVGSELCDGLSVGSFFFMNINAWETHVYGHTDDERHGEVMILGFQDIPGGIDLFLTDKAWSRADNAFVTEDIKGEGILHLRVPDGGIPSGQAFGVGDDAGVYAYGTDWTDYNVNGTTSVVADTNGNYTNTTTDKYYFGLGGDGDQIFLYCIASNGMDRPIAGISYNGPFLTVDDVGGTIDGYGTNTSSIPNELLADNGTLVMPVPSDDDGTIFLKWQYTGPMKLNFFELQDAVQNISTNWMGFNPDGSTYGSSGAVTTTTSVLTSFFGVGLVMFMMSF